jgi:hypothetical protein
VTRIITATLFEADGTTPVHPLAAASDLRWLDELTDTGSFSLRIPVEYVPNIAIGQIVKFAFGASSSDYVWAGVVESIRVNQVGAGEDGVAREYEIGGRGVRALLEDAIVYNSGASATRTFTSVTAGEIMKTLVDEAQARGALTPLTYDFDNTDDSDGNAFTETLSIDEPVGGTLLGVAAKHQELAVDAWVGPDLTLHYVNERGTDKSQGGTAVVLRVGQNVGELTQETAGPVRNTVLVGSGADGTTFVEEEDTISQGIYGRRETFLALTSTADTGVVTLAATHVLNNAANPSDGTTVQVSDTGALPYVDFEVGDTIALVRVDGSRTAYRVRGITVQVGADGSVAFIPELGTARPDLTRRLASVLQRIERNNAGSESESATSGGLAGLGGGFGGGGELVNGEVQTYNPSTEAGTVDIDGTTENFTNGTGFGLNVGDIVVLTQVGGITDKVAVGIFDRVGSYTPIVLNNPQAVSGFPFDGDQLPNQFNYVFDVAASGGTFGVNHSAAPGAWFGSGVLGYAGRVLVFLSRTSTTAQVPIIIYDVETGSSTAINRTAAVGATNRSHSVGVIGTRMFITYDGSSGNCVESWDSSTGTWTAHAIRSAVYLGVSGGYAWWLGTASTGSPPRWELYSIDSAGTLSSTQTFGTFYRNGTLTGADTTNAVYGRAKNGRVYFSFNVTNADTLYTAATTGDAASLTFTSATAPSTLPWTATANSAGSTALRDANRSYACSDIDDDEYLYFFVRTGTPTTAGFAKVDPTTLAVTTYTQLTSATGNAADGELLISSGLCLAGSQVVLFGAIREDVADPLGRSTSFIPAYWRTDGVTTNRTDDLEYVGLNPGADVAARTSPVHRDSVSSTFYFHTNKAGWSVVGSGTTNADTGGPAYGEAVTV